MKVKLLKITQDAGVVAGVALFVYGLWLIYHPLGPIVGGLLLTVISFFPAYDRMRKGGTR